eukprot:6543585-Prymnesium_polylepis.1
MQTVSRTTAPSSPAVAGGSGGAEVTDKELMAEFRGAIQDPVLVSRCRKICEMYKMSASELEAEWGLLQVNGRVKSPMSVAGLDVLNNACKDAFLTRQAREKKQFSARAAKSS